MQVPAPAVRVVVQVSNVLAVTITLPVGVPPVVGVTLNATATAPPVFDGFGVLEVIAVVVPALLTVSVVLVSVTAPKVPSPA